MKKLITALMLCVGFGLAGFAQAQGNVDDVETVLGYNPDVVLQDWKSWEEKKTAENKFIEDFMTDYEVPQQGLYGFDLHNTWYWWIQTNKEAIEKYLTIKEENSLE